MSDVLLLNSPLFRNGKRASFDDLLPPFGLGYIATYLKKNSFSVDLIDAVSKNLTLEEAAGLAEKQDFVGMNIFSTNLDLVRDIIGMDDSCTHYILGGSAARHLVQEIRSFNTKNKIDIVMGDGEYITPDILRDKLKEMPVISKGNVRAFDVSAGSQYFPNDISTLTLDREFLSDEPGLNHYGLSEANIVTSRGCSYNCAFCGAAKSLNSNVPIRIRSRKSIKEELYQLRSHYAIECVRVLDDLFLRNGKSMESALEIFGETDLKWRAMAHINSFKAVPEDVLKRLRKNGCTEISIGIESGSERMLSLINKQYSPETAGTVLENLLDAGLSIKGYFIFGLPGETEHDLKESFNLASRIKEHSLKTSADFRVSVFQFRPYHGTILYNQLVNKRLDFKHNQHLSENIGREHFNFYTENFSICSDEVLDEYIISTMKLNNS